MEVSLYIFYSEILIKSKIDIIKNSKYSQAELNHRLLPDMHAVTDIRAKLYQLSYESIIHGNPGLGFCLLRGSNTRPSVYKTDAITTLLKRLLGYSWWGLNPRSSAY